MKLISWNVNGLRACLTKGFAEYFEAQQADIFCIQETKLQEHQMEFAPEGYKVFLSCAQKKGYSGTAIFTKAEPLSVQYGIGGKYSDEGRLITLEYEGFYMLCCYSPNSQDGLKRLDYRLAFEDELRGYMLELDKLKPVILCGDLNVAANPIDLKNPKSNVNNAGFTPEERAKFALLLESGFADTFREMYPTLEGAYSWWSYRFNARANNAGWRIDYFIISRRIAERAEKASIFSDVMGSDHCPVGLEISL